MPTHACRNNWEQLPHNHVSLGEKCCYFVCLVYIIVYFEALFFTGFTQSYNLCSNHAISFTFHWMNVRKVGAIRVGLKVTKHFD